MYLLATILLLILLLFYFHEINTNMSPTSTFVPNIEINNTSEIIGNSESNNWANYETTPIPKIPYVTHYDVIAPPKAVVEINCPECDNKWE